MAESNSSAVRRRRRRRRKKKTTTSEFPIKLYAMLEVADSISISEFAQAVTWLPHGRAFVILDKVKFMKDVVPLFFNQTKIQSFSRQLSLWGFRRIGKRGNNKQVWYHDNFLRGKPENIKFMVRTKIKGNLTSSRETVSDGPHFDCLPPLPACVKWPTAVLNIIEDTISKLPASYFDHCLSTKSTVSKNNHAMVSQRTETETPCQFNMDCNQDECLLPPFHGSVVSNEGQEKMTHCVPALWSSAITRPHISAPATQPSR